MLRVQISPRYIHIKEKEEKGRRSKKQQEEEEEEAEAEVEKEGEEEEEENNEEEEEEHDDDDDDDDDGEEEEEEKTEADALHSISAKSNKRNVRQPIKISLKSAKLCKVYLPPSLRPYGFFHYTSFPILNIGASLSLSLSVLCLFFLRAE